MAKIEFTFKQLDRLISSSSIEDINNNLRIIKDHLTKKTKFKELINSKSSSIHLNNFFELEEERKNWCDECLKSEYSLFYDKKSVELFSVESAINNQWKLDNALSSCIDFKGLPFIEGIDLTKTNYFLECAGEPSLLDHLILNIYTYYIRFLNELYDLKKKLNLKKRNIKKLKSNLDDLIQIIQDDLNVLDIDDFFEDNEIKHWTKEFETLISIKGIQGINGLNTNQKSSLLLYLLKDKNKQLGFVLNKSNKILDKNDLVNFDLTLSNLSLDFCKSVYSSVEQLGLQNEINSTWLHNLHLRLINQKFIDRNKDDYYQFIDKSKIKNHLFC